MWHHSLKQNKFGKQRLLDKIIFITSDILTKLVDIASFSMLHVYFVFLHWSLKISLVHASVIQHCFQPACVILYFTIMQHGLTLLSLKSSFVWGYAKMSSNKLKRLPQNPSKPKWNVCLSWWCLLFWNSVYTLHHWLVSLTYPQLAILT